MVWVFWDQIAFILVLWSGGCVVGGCCGGGAQADGDEQYGFFMVIISNHSCGGSVSVCTANE